MTIDEERSAIAGVMGGDASSFEALVLDNQKKVYNLALRLTGNEDDALDLSQEAFLRAYTHLGSFKAESRFFVWLYRITYNICTDFLRKRARERGAGIVSLSEYDEEGDMEIPDARALPEEALLRKETRERIGECVERLSPAHREILLLRELSGMSYAELASVTGAGEGTIKSRLSRARQALARELTADGTIEGKLRHTEKQSDEEASGR